MGEAQIIGINKVKRFPATGSESCPVPIELRDVQRAWQMGMTRRIRLTSERKHLHKVCFAGLLYLRNTFPISIRYFQCFVVRTDNHAPESGEVVVAMKPFRS